MKMPIPTDWDGTGFCDYLINWPDSPMWRRILKGLVSDPALEIFWDEQTGDVPEILADFEPTLNPNLDNLECDTMIIPVGSIVAFAGSVAPEGWLLCDGSILAQDEYVLLYLVIGRTYGGVEANATYALPDLRSRVPVGRNSGDTAFDVLGETGGEKTHTLTATEIPVHTHTQNSHNHTQNSHNHTQNSHNHTQDPHTHTIFGMQLAAPTGVRVSLAVNSQADNTISAPTTATNQAATATNQAATATNQAATATNQNAGGDGAHNNLQPYLTLNYIIKAF